jgi:uncharacterized protein (UPF0276 family)
MTQQRLGVPDLGVGVGLRVPHYRHILEQHPAVDFFEIISENFMVDGGKPLYHLDRVLESYPVIQHGVSLNIGGPDPLDRDYLRRLKQLVRRVKPAWLSDHFCWTSAGGANLHDLLPLPYTRQVIDRVVERARQVQDTLEVPFALENTSSYMAYRQSEMTEWQFVSEVVERANIGLMFDVNNVYVSAYNHGFDAYEFIRNVPHERIVQIHLAGHTNLGKVIIDTHNGDVIDPVWDLYRATIELTGAVSTLIEWDDQIPPFEVVQRLAARAKRARDEGLATRRARTSGAAAASWVEGRCLVPTPTTAATSSPSQAGWKQGGDREHAGDAGQATP